MASQWQSWNLEQWSDALLDAFFVETADAHEPITQLVITPDRLVHVVHDATADPADVRAHFLGLFRPIVRPEYGVRPQSVGAHARDLSRGWSIEGRKTPPFLPHLILTCLAATDLEGENNNFRNHLNQMLDVEGANHGLEFIADLWRQFFLWLERQRAGGRNLQLVREPDVGGLTQIGYAVRLAFPPRRDQRLLGRLLAEKDLLGTEPPVEAVRDLVVANLRYFTSEFRKAFQEFDVQLRQGETPRRNAFWSAVREATLQHFAPRAHTRALSLLLALDPSANSSGRLVLFLMADRDDVPLPAGFSVVASDPAVGDHAYLVIDSGQSWVGSQLMAQHPSSPLQPLLPSTLKRSIQDGVLLFAQGAHSIYTHVAARPRSGEMYAFVRSELAADFLRVVQRQTPGCSLRTAAESGWREVHGLSGEELHSLSFGGVPSLASVRCLQQFLPGASITLVDGLRIHEGFLGMAPFLPNVIVDRADRVVGTKAGESNAGDDALSLERIADDRWRFPPGDLDGIYRIAGSYADQTIADRLVYFRTDVPTAYLPPTDMARWIAEEPSLCTATEYKSEGRLTAISGDEEANVVSAGLDQCLAACAATGIQRRGISHVELFDIIAKTLNIEEPRLVWAVVRAWCEQGMFDRLTYRHWRTRRYFPNRPHIVCGQVGGRYVATLAGLIPPSLRADVRRSAARREVVLRFRHAQSEWVPSLLSLEASELHELLAVGRDVSIDHIGYLGDAAPPPVMKLEPMATRPWRSERFFLYDIPMASFRRAVSTIPTSGVSTVWCSDRDRPTSQRNRPDYFVVAQDGKELGWTYARAAATTIALHLGKDAAFRDDGDYAVARDPGTELYLPIAFARLLALTSRHPPGPVVTNEGWAYRYTFPTGEARDATLKELYPTASSIPPALVARAAWVYRFVAADGPRAEISLPEDVRITLMRLGTHELLTIPPRSVTRRLFPHVIALVKAIRGHDA